MSINPFNLNPVRLENFYAYPYGHKHYGKIKCLLNYNPFKVGEDIDIDTKQIRITGTIERIKDKIIIVKMAKLLHKEAIN
jgi:hypothetical protein